MPELGTPPALEHVNLDSEADYIFGNDAVPRLVAANLVRQSFDQWDAHNSRRRSRYKKAMTLYLAEQGQVRYWPGTAERRHSVPSHLIFDHAEAAYPLLSATIFHRAPYWFDVLPARGSTPAEAAQLQEALAFAYEPDRSVAELTGVRAAKAALFTAMIYGNCYGAVGWDPEQRRAYLEYVSVYDTYLPPRVGSLIDSAHAWMRRRLVSVEDLYNLRGDPRVTLPPLAVLNYFAKVRHSVGDDAKRTGDMLRGLSGVVGPEEPNPTSRPVEVLEYEEKGRIIWVVERLVAIYNEPNPLGMLSLVGSPYLWVPDSHYGLGFAEFLEPEQRVDYGLSNEFLDQVALLTTPPRTRRLGGPEAPSRTAWKPGAVNVSKDPKDDLRPMLPGQSLSEMITARSLNERAASKRTGISEMAQQGLPTPSNANRTLGGIQAQAGAVQQRQFRPIETFEDYYLIESLRKIQRVLQVFGGSQALTGIAQDGSESTVPAAAASTAARFRILASSKTISRAALLPVLPTILGFYLNPQIMEQALRVGKTIDFEELDRLVQDATSTRDRYRIYRPITPQEQEAVAQGTVAEQQKSEQAEQSSQTRLEAARIKAETDREKIASQERTAEDATAVKLFEVVQGNKEDTG